MLEVARGEFADDVLKCANQEFGLFPDSEFICMNLFLAFGDISGIKSVKTRDVFGEIIEVEKQITSLQDAVKRHKKIRIWTSTATTEDYLNMLFILDLLWPKNKDLDISVIDSAKVPVREKYPDTPAWELACLETDSIEKLLLFEEKMTNKKAVELMQDWNDIVSKNSSLRICKNGVVESVDDDYFDQIMLDAMSDLGKAERSELIGSAMARCDHNDGNLSDWFFANRLDKLIMACKIKIDKSNDQSSVVELV
ncbi:MAG: DUF3658 domain-containing protein [Ignavibacteria bacterium]|nr:DUF3658 domain-containing protein [Ignavibacteria bacterium]